MLTKRHSSEQIISKLREAEVHLAKPNGCVVRLPTLWTLKNNRPKEVSA